MVTIMIVMKEKEKIATKETWLIFWKRNCSDFKAVSFQKSGKRNSFIFKVFLVATFNDFPFLLLSLLLYIVILLIIIIKKINVIIVSSLLLHPSDILSFLSFLFCAEVIIFKFCPCNKFETVVSNFQPSRFPGKEGRPDHPNYLVTPSPFCLCFFLKK